jgi:hypothetical protein
LRAIRTTAWNETRGPPIRVLAKPPSPKVVHRPVAALRKSMTGNGGKVSMTGSPRW